jgi:hypothetical protein
MRSTVCTLALLAACTPAPGRKPLSTPPPAAPESPAELEAEPEEPEKVEAVARIEDCSTASVVLIERSFSKLPFGGNFADEESNEGYQRYERLGPVWTCDGAMDRFRIVEVQRGPFSRSGSDQTGYVLEEPKCSTRPPPAAERRFRVLEGNENGYWLSRRDRKPLAPFHQVAMDVPVPADIDLKGSVDLDADGIVELVGLTGPEGSDNQVLGIWKLETAGYVRIFAGQYSEGNHGPICDKHQPMLEVDLEFTRLNREAIRLTETVKGAPCAEFEPPAYEWSIVGTKVTDLALPRQGACPFLGQ